MYSCGDTGKTPKMLVGCLSHLHAAPGPVHAAPGPEAAVPRMRLKNKPSSAAFIFTSCVPVEK